MWLNAVGAFFVALTFYTPTALADPFWVPKRQLMLAGLLMLSMVPVTSSNKVPYAFTAICCYVAAHFTYSFVFSSSIMSWQIFPMLLAIVVCLFTTRLLQNSTEYGLQRLATWVSVTILLMTAFVLLQWAGFSQWLPQAQDSVGSRSNSMFGTLGNHMLVGNFLAMGAPFLLMFRRMRLAYPIVLLAIFLSDNNAGLLATGLSLIIWFFLTNQHLLFFISLCAGGLGSIWAFNLSDGGRIAMGEAGLSLLSSSGSAITGFGIGAVEHLFRTGVYTVPGYAPFHPHNELVFLTMELGIIGLGLFVWLAVSFVCRILRAQTTTLLAGYAASSIACFIICLFSFPTQVPPLLLLLIISLCGTWNLTKEYRYVSA